MTVTSEYCDQFTSPAGYLDHAAIGPPSRSAASALVDAFTGAREPKGNIGPTLREIVDRARRGAARLLRSDVDHTGLIHSTSEGLFSVAYGLGEGGNVVVPRTEFPANIYPWLRAAERRGPAVRLVDVPGGRPTADLLRPHIDSETRAVALSQVDFLTGFQVDISSMREVTGEALLVVDAIQAAGAVEVELAPADVVVVGGQKWMRAGNGAGFLAMSDRALDRLDTSLVGWTGVEDFLATEIPTPHAPLAGADRFQLGSAPLVMAAPLAAAIELILSAGIAAIESTVLRNIEALEEVIRSAGATVLSPWRNPDERAGILSFQLSGVPPEVIVEALAGSAIIASVRGGNWVRLSPHASTPVSVADEVGRVLASLKV